MNSIVQKFEGIGARIKIHERPANPRVLALSPLQRRAAGMGLFGNGDRPVVVDVKTDRLGEYFDIEKTEGTELKILDFNKADRHLLLMALNGKEKPKYLLGHDERHWFAAAIPEPKTKRISAATGAEQDAVPMGVANITQAKQVLKPKGIVSRERGRVEAKNLHKRHRKLLGGGKIHRQGEFMFYPEPEFKPYDDCVLRNEPMRRGAIGRASPRQVMGGKPHMAEYLYRTGGTTVYVNGQYPNGLTQNQYDTLIRKDPMAKKMMWRTMQRDATAYVKGRIRHSDHKTVDLGDVWHRVFVNTENVASHSSTVAFLD